MKTEIDLRSLIVKNLDFKDHDMSPYSIYMNNEDNIIERPFENFRKWNKVEQSSYIESIFLRCSLQPIIRFKMHDHTVIIDGQNRYNAIVDFCNNKLKLKEKGLKQLKFLANKTFSTLSSEEYSFFKKSDPIRIFDYNYNKKVDSENDKKISKEEEYEIVRYLHFVYNIGLRLEKEEMQKAQFYDDYITNRIRDKIQKEPDFLKMLEAFKQFNGYKKKNRIENILLNCRLLIASTYSNMLHYSSIQSIQERIEETYLPNLKNADEEKVFQDFNINLNLIYNNLICTQKWEVYPELHTKPFLDATYWLISVIKKDKLGEPLAFDFMKYLEYFGESEERSRNFEVYQSHYKNNILKRYKAVAKYYEDNYGYNMMAYFEQIINKNNLPEKIKDIEDLCKFHFEFSTHKVKISTLLHDIKESDYNLRPIYQRAENMNIVMSSKIIESILLGIKIPYLLFYNNLENDKVITEVVDGQQRILALLAFLQKPFSNINSELEYSIKNGFALKDLKVLSELNGTSANKKNAKKLKEDQMNKILNTELFISKNNFKKDSNFSAIDHFIRLNKNAFTIKENSYRMWYLTVDKEIIQFERNITYKFIGKLLPPINQTRSANILTLRLANLFFYKNTKEITRNDYTNSKVTVWLNELSREKNKYVVVEPEKVSKIREPYLKALSDTEEFYYKVESFLKKIHLTIRELLVLKKYSNIPLINYYYLFAMLEHISNEDLQKNSESISRYIINFFKKLKDFKNDHESINKELNYAIQQISIFDKNKQLEFKEKLEQAIKMYK